MPGAMDKQVDGDHYKEMGIQPWTIIEKNGLDYFEGAALKYLLRWRHKDGLVDLDKIIHYVERIKELAISGHYGMKFIQKPVDMEIDYKGAFKCPSSAQNKPSGARSTKKRTKPSLKRKKA